ncbi:anti-sigma factor domain-containing protein [Desulfitobacterium hafniense]|uniref:RsgI N-terminal anti-sigma domain-containing protein n=1 Tax=Desulfitobacterium hafniense (strain Y51) TaxID=138119 RepID=Q24NT8_DESHY|nr:anti-sigma factor domain-containing protein [Desulfitobacterium hafniense]BAE86304.1 hypothetical protein DSY4515 [Desulfitobacterium hafniense Y51]
MKKVKGIVMKTSKMTSIVYTSSGDYLKVKTPKPSPLVGQVIEVEVQSSKSFSRGFIKYGSIAAAMVLALTLSLFNIFSVPKAAVASIIMDLDTSMEIQVDKDAKILGVNESNQGSKGTPSDLNLEGIDIYKAVELIIDKANTEGAFEQKNLILTSIVPIDSKYEGIIDEDRLRNSIESYMLENDISADMMVIEINEETLQQARKSGMSVNHYQVYKRIQEQGLTTSPSLSDSNDALHMMSEANTTLESLFPHESMTITPQTKMHDDSKSMNMEEMPGSNSMSMDSNGSTSSGMMSENQHQDIDPSESMHKRDSKDREMMPSKEKMDGPR